MTDLEQRQAAKKFADFWKGKGYEKGESQQFWISLLTDVLGVKNVNEFITFESKVKLDNTSFIDGIIKETHVLIEQKSIDKSLKSGIRQSDGSILTPFQQAKRYSAELPYSERPRWIVTSNFKSFLIYDMENTNSEPEEILLENLPKEYYRFGFLIDKENGNIKKEMEISIKAGQLVGKLYDAFYKEYKDPTQKESQESLNILCVRLVFCLYAEDAGLFGRKNVFHDYLARYDVRDIRKALIDLFKILDTKVEERDKYLDEDLAQFPYVNGGLFSNENIEIPFFTEEIKTLLLAKASDGFDWSEISPTIFGAVFESTLNQETRRSGGMHYTSIENIHKVIDPLFMNDLNEEFSEIKQVKNEKERNKKLDKFQLKIAGLKFLDPACGSGNFLTETYLSLRRLENDILRLKSIQITMGLIENPIKVSIHQFYGIEINDFAVTVAKTALWIAESQMMKKTEDIIHVSLDFLPLKSYDNIYEGNALRIDWNDVLPNYQCNYIMGNPPFVGQSVRSKQQSIDMINIFGQGEIETKLDYVLCWYKKAAQYMLNTKIICGFVSTNSICQGESVPTFWKNMVKDYNVEIQFAHTNFIWDSEANQKAHVHCVIVGFTIYETKNKKYIFSDGRFNKSQHINAYLYNAPDIWIENRTNKPFNNLPKMTTGNPPTDGGGLLLSKEEKDELLNKYPILSKYIKPFIGAREFLHDKIGQYSRYCLWFVDGNPSDYNKIPELKERFEIVRNIRLKSNADRIQKMAIYPYLFCQNRQPNSTYLVIPRHSSERRRYIPIGFVNSNIIAGDACTIVPNISIYYFGILTSNIHMAWMRIVAGRLKSDYRYSPLIYNNFPWPNPTPEQKKKIEKTAQAILDARSLYPDSTLSDLYDDLTMPPELRKAHQLNNRAVKEAYGFINNETESEVVAKLMEMYKEVTDNK